MKRRTIFFVFLLSFLCLQAQNKVKVACVGNSVTYGYLLPDREKTSYPAQLQSLLGSTYEVGNFGKSGATLLSKGHRPYIKEPEYKEALKFNGDIVVIHLGLNDTDPRNWPNYRDEFVTDYLNLIQSFRLQNPNVEIFICRMSPIFSGHFRFLSGTRDWFGEIQQAIEDVSRLANVKLLDFEEILRHRPDLFPDNLHPIAEGATVLAETVYGAITGNYGGLQMPEIYSDNMVLQRNQFLKIEGTANANDKITVQIGKQTHKTQANYNGKWSVVLDPLSVGKALSLQISTKDRVLHYKNVLVGEVWLCSGQSNMAFSLNRDFDFKVLGNKSIHKNIRIFDMQPKWETNAFEWDSTALVSLNKLDYYQKATWKECDETNAPRFSAVAYYFGCMLADSLDVPIGLIQNAIGGSNIESWVDRKNLEYHFPEIFHNWTKNDFLQDWVRDRAIVNIKKSRNPLQRHPYQPSYLFESGIMSLHKYPIKGVIWYQGESNAHNIEAHERLFPLFVDGLRKYWDNETLPVYYVQLSSLNRPSWAWFRDSQRRLMDKIPHSYMAVTSDRGDSLDVHPVYKKDVGSRLALWALNKTYKKENIIPSGPLYKSVEFKDGNAYVSFSYSVGLKASNNEEIVGFELAETEGLYYPATAEMVGNTIKLSSAEVKNPQFVRYGWQPFSRANLVNGQGLPASTFKTEKKYLNKMENNLKCEALPNYPIQGGVSGMFIGVHKNKLIVAGGCNFPKKPASEGGEKVFYKDVYLLDLDDNTNNQKWIKCTPFLTEVAYGSSVNTENGILFIGGQNKKGGLSDVILVKYDDQKNDVIYSKLPSLPVSQFNGDATILDNVVYVAGGSIDKTVYTFDLNNEKASWIKLEGSLPSERQQPVLVSQDGNLFLAGGFEENQAKAFTDILKYDFQSKNWTKYDNIMPNSGDLKTFVGASGFAYGKDQVLFVGGVNYERFSSALQRIQKTQLAKDKNDQELLKRFSGEKDFYMTQQPEWYNFNRSISVLNLDKKTWTSFGDFEQIARAGAAITLSGNKMYVVCGELKPGIRTNSVNCLIIE